MSDYDLEAVDRLPFSTPEKSQRYRTENYRGAVGLNWYETDPSLQLTMAYYLQPDELAVAEPHLRRIGALMGGPVARWAEQTDRNPARLERYDRWGHDISQVVQPTSFTESKRAVLDAQKALKDDARRARVNPSLPLYAANYLLDQADIGLGCALGTGSGMVKSLVAAYAPADVREHVLAKFETGEWEGETAQLLTERAGGSADEHRHQRRHGISDHHGHGLRVDTPAHAVRARIAPASMKGGMDVLCTAPPFKISPKPRCIRC